ncbi:MAG: stalk domain-containing protein [Desulfotomaculales bacterium]
MPFRPMGKAFFLLVAFLAAVALAVPPGNTPAFAAASGDASITVVYPNGNEVWEMGSQQTIRWTYTGNPGSEVVIELRDGYSEPGYAGGKVYGVGRTSIGQNGVGSYTFTVPWDLRPACTYQVRISVPNARYNDRSDDDFKILPPGGQPPITLLSPNGGEVWAPGSTQTIRWLYTEELAGQTGSVDIYYFKNTNDYYYKLGSAPLGQNGTGSYTWEISTKSGPGKSPGSDYKIAVVAHNQRFIRDTSDSFFTIGFAPPPQQERTVQPPVEPQPPAGGTALTYNLPSQFSATQGANNWYYLYGNLPAGPNQAAWDNQVSPWGVVDHYGWNGGSGYSGPRYLEITGRDPADWRKPGPGGWLQPGEGADISFGWKAPRAGTVYIRGMLNTSYPEATAGGATDDGVWFSIWKGNSRLTEEERVFRGNDQWSRTPFVTQKTTATVAAGDMIYFYIRRGNWQDCDGMYYSFTVTYDPNGDLDPPACNHMVSGGTVSLIATDTGSGVAAIEYAVHEETSGKWSAWKTYQGPFAPTGIDELMYRAIDNAGNLGPYQLVGAEQLPPPQPAGQVLINDPSFVTLTAIPNPFGQADIAYNLQVKANNPAYPVEVSYLLLNPNGTPQNPSTGIEVHPAGEFESTWGSAAQYFYHTEVGGWARPEYKVNPQVFGLPHYRTAVMLLARYEKIYLVFLRENDGRLTCQVFKGGAFNGLDVPGLGQVTRAGNQFKIHSSGGAVEVGIWDKGQYLHDEVKGWAQQSYQANDKLYDIPHYGMFMLMIARYDKMGLIIGNFNDGQLGTICFTGSRYLMRETVPGLCEVFSVGGLDLEGTTDRSPRIEVKATAGKPVEVSHFAFDNTCWQWEVGGWAREEFRENPQILPLKHYTPGFIMVSRYDEAGIFFYNENDLETGVLPIVAVAQTGAGIPQAPQQPSRITVLLNGRPLSFDQPPVIINGRTMVPLRAIFQALGAEVNWDGATQTVTATRGDTVIILVIGSPVAFKDGQAVILDQPALLMAGRTMVPLRFIAEALGAEVNWDGTTQTVTILH